MMGTMKLVSRVRAPAATAARSTAVGAKPPYARQTVRWIAGDGEVLKFTGGWRVPLPDQDLTNG